MKEASALYRLLGDEARLRLLRVLDKDRFNVKELTGILGLAQSGVSRHLGLLKESELVVEERDGAYSFYRLAPAVRDDAKSPLWPLLQAQFEAAAALADGEGRRFAAAGSAAAAPRELRARRPRHARRPAAGAGPQLGGVVARAGTAAAAARGRRPRVRRRLPHRRDRALGEARDRGRSLDRRAGARQGAGRRARSCRTSPGRRASSKSCRSTAARWTWRCCRRRCITRRSPRRRWRKRRAILKPGGRLLILDLRPHDETWVREKLGDQLVRVQRRTSVGPADARRLHRRPRRARRAAHQRSVCGAARDRDEEDKEQEIAESSNKNEERLMTTSTLSNACSPNASSSSMARWAPWSSAAS